MKTTFLYIIAVTLIFSACKKKEKTDPPTPGTIEPGSYFPVYPGSWWKYVVNNSDTINSQVSNDYVLNSFNNSYDQHTHSDGMYVPYLDGNPIYRYQKVAWIAPPFGNYYALWPILSETVGDQFERSWTDKRFGDFSEYVTVTQKYASDSDSVLVLEGHWVYGPNATHKSYQYYYKNVGLKHEVIVDTISMDTIYQKKLIDYLINQ
jgi:hypothetical protein